jgi:GTPase involved in cell partitioning and DNA repair
MKAEGLPNVGKSTLLILSKAKAPIFLLHHRTGVVN